MLCLHRLYYLYIIEGAMAKVMVSGLKTFKLPVKVNISYMYML
jgi:hypothetical protein